MAPSSARRSRSKLPGSDGRTRRRHAPAGVAAPRGLRRPAGLELLPHALPQPHVLFGHPVDQVLRGAVDPRRRVGDDLRLELGADASLVEQVEHAAQAQRIVEELDPAGVQPVEQVVDRLQPEVEVALQLATVDLELRRQVLAKLQVAAQRGQAGLPRRPGSAASAAPRCPAGSAA